MTSIISARTRSLWVFVTAFVCWSYLTQAQQPILVVATGLIAFTRAAACPSGWSEYTTARGRSMVGLVAAGTNEGTAGTALTNTESRADGQHTHTVTESAHSHTVTDPGHIHGSRVGAVNLQVGDPITTPSFILDFAGVTSSATTSVTLGTQTANVTINNAGSVAGTNAPYIQLLACARN